MVGKGVDFNNIENEGKYEAKDDQNSTSTLLPFAVSYRVAGWQF
jgi:hypothetical protein